jgi:hypothetical protein
MPANKSINLNFVFSRGGKGDMVLIKSYRLRISFWIRKLSMTGRMRKSAVTSSTAENSVSYACA